jgi:death-on-curing protein
MTAWRRSGLELVHAVYDGQLAEHGWIEGVREMSAIESDLAGPMNASI